MGWYDIAQICLNGHVINDSIKDSPEFSQKYCDRCGAETITKCQNCSKDIKGEYHVEGVISMSHYSAPSFCHECGQPFPWTNERIIAAKELANEVDDISDEERTLLEKSIDEIVRETPRTTLASNRFKKIVSKSGKMFADGFRDILVDIVSETAKKIIWPDN